MMMIVIFVQMSLNDCCDVNEVRSRQPQVVRCTEYHLAENEVTGTTLLMFCAAAPPRGKNKSTLYIIKQ